MKLKNTLELILKAVLFTVNVLALSKVYLKALPVRSLKRHKMVIKLDVGILR